MSSQPTPWTDLAAAKAAESQRKIPAEWRLPSCYTDRVSDSSTWSVLHVPRESGILTARELEITENYDAVALVAEVAKKTYTAEEVAVAFCKRAAVAQQLTNCLTEIMFDDAIARAKELDEYLRVNGKTMGPLHGLPISLKDSFHIKGYESTIGFVSFIGRSKATSNAPLVDILLSLGAVLYVKTNIPQTMMTADSQNNIFGRVLNPHNLSLTAGGSSGGEGALIALRGSLLGVGTDIAGSIRIPALCCGTFGFKPSTGRIPYAGQNSGGRKGSPGILACAGPLATSFRDLEFLMRNVLDAKPWDLDPGVLPVEWRTRDERKPVLKIGVVLQDPEAPVQPPVLRTLNEAVNALKRAGHTVTTLSFVPSISNAAMLSYKLFCLDETKSALRHIQASGEPPIPSLKDSIPDFGKLFTLSDMHDFNAERMDLAAAWQRIWNMQALDVLLMPGHSKTASPHDTYGSPPYTVVWNLMDCPAAVIPFGKVDQEKDAAPGYDPGLYSNAPCSIQLVGRKFRDEELLAVADVVRSGLSA
ncbi:amidase signature domain-containing protein [Aspergillus egyptiacus]|nr:amidase signature domain-containing protein [Aspergillus egyptiacus]